MLKTTTPSRTPIYSSAPLSNSHSPSSSLDNASQAIAAATGVASWDTLRKEVRQIETEIESKLTALSKLAVRNGSASAPPQAAAGAGAPGAGAAAANGEELEANIEELLEKVRLANGHTLAVDRFPCTTPLLVINGYFSLTNVLSFDVTFSNKILQLSRTVDAMSGHLDSQTQTNGQAPLSMTHLLQKHRDILHDYTKEYRKTRQNVRAARDHAQLLTSVRDDISSFKNGGMSASDYLLNERSRIDGSHNLADSALE
jgi:Golgi SNAP receptor complex protein 1